MKSGVPWSIRGIDDETREAARAAAQRSGLSVAEWLNEIIAEHTGEMLAPRGETDEGGAEEAIAASLDRLNRRIRGMDLKSRSAVPELASRLDEIERSLGGLPPVSRNVGERSRSLKSVAGMIEDLSRELDSADENARTMIEGLRGRASRAGTRLGGGADVGDAIRDLDTRISAMVERGKPKSREREPYQLDNLKHQLDALLAKVPKPAFASPAADRTASLDAALRTLETRIDSAKAELIARPPASSTEEGDRMRRIEARLADVTSHLAPPTPPKSPRLGDDLASAIAEIAARQKALDDRSEALDSVSSLRNDIAELTERMAAFGRVGAEEKGAFYDLVRRIDALATERPLDRHLLSSIRSDLEALRITIEGEQGRAGLVARLDNLIEKTPDPGKLDALAEEVAVMRRALEATDSPRAIARLEMRMAELARSVEAAVNGEGKARRQTESEGLSRLEASLNEVAARIDGLLDRAPKVDDFAAIHDRIADLAKRLEDIDAFQRGPAAALDEIKSELAALRGEISGRPQSSTAHLESQVAQLANRLDDVIRTGSDHEGLAELEAQVMHLSAELERAMPRTSALKHVEENLAQLQAILVGSRQESVEAARVAARQAVSELASGSDSGLLKSLKDDLASVRGVAGDTDARTRAVNDTLAKVVERLSRLEAGEAPPRPAMKPADDIARAEPATSWNSSSGLPEDNRPLEPGSGKPDLAALRELAGSASHTGERRNADRKADFIAAARRAAQAAAAEAAPSRATEEAEEGDQKPGAFARIGQAIRNRRRPLLLAAAAIVLAIGALQIFGDRLPGVVESAANEEPLISKVEPAAATPREHDTAGFAASAAVSQTAMVAPPKDGGGAALAFAEPEAFDSRFGSTPNAPPSSAFSPAPAKAAPPLPPDAQSVSLDTTASASKQVAPMPDAGIGSTRLREAAASGDPAAAFEVAVRYAEGRGVPADLAKASEWYTRAATGGIAVAQYRLGSLYERGQGVAKDSEAAATWYQRAADQGNVGAMHNLAVLMSEGVDGVADQAKALQWFQNAAFYGVKDSQYNLGVIYARGIGVPADMLEAYKWFAVAAAQGDTDAAARRDDIAKTMSPDDLAKARAAVSTWQAKPALPEANAVPAPEGGWDEPAATVSASDQSKLVTKIQELLAEQGYDPGPADGVPGAKTRQAVRAFQKTIGVAETGEISRDLVTALVGQT